VQIPNLAGQPAGVAQSTLESLGFTVGQRQEFSVEIPSGNVIQTDPGEGASVDKGSKVTLIVSKGPRTFAMPNVVGMATEAAKAKLESLGLEVNVGTIQNTSGGQVLFQDPAEGVTVQQGQRVWIYVTES
jgi:serine/threonine-protein kinase